ncbi:unnamed protein product [Prorocentrum cordatum]|uniref:Phospholipase B-like n=1 Tax=Prorocentrum cordatum TaxID=2364126 RepID=A0ABN9P9K7_9DINO|nr:unnamed protein product [Polarella glacialis]
MTMVSKVASVLACLSVARALAGNQAQDAGRSVASAGRAACDCLEFAAVYYDNLASCGRARELYFLTKYGASEAYAPTEPIAGLPHQVCNNFFKNLKNNSCVNVDMFSFPSETSDASAGQSWCYVSNECLSLNGGTFATNTLGFAMGGWNNLQSTSNLSWKVCDSSSDSILKDKTMDELIAIGSESDVSMATLLRYAYPAVSITWGEAREFLETLNDADHWNDGLSLADNVNAIASPPATWGTRLPFVHTTLSGIVTSEQGTILDSPGHRDEFHVVVGREVWEVKRIDEGNMAYLAGKFYREFDVICRFGCSSTAREAPLDLLTQ